MATPSSASGGVLAQSQALAPFLESLNDTARDRPVHVLQIGDSHTAGDLITASLRSRLQARFGRGGRGVIPPGRPYAGYQPRQIEVIEAGWSSRTAPPGQGAWPATGLSGTRGLMGGSGRLDMVAEPGAAFTRVVICGSGSGTVILEIDGAVHDLAFVASAVCPEVVLTVPAHRLALRRGEGAAEVHSIATFADDGLAVSNLGVIGATLADLAARDEVIAAVELAAWAPDLIILAFGTNEGFDPGLDPITYEALLRGQIARLRRLAPGAALMLLGPPDAMSPDRGGLCERVGGDRWRNPPMLAVVRDVQRRVAADMGVAFWDWRMAMGGDCSAHRLATAPEPLMRGDHVHFNSAGGDWIGRLIFDALMAAHEAHGADQP